MGDNESKIDVGIGINGVITIQQWLKKKKKQWIHYCYELNEGQVKAYKDGKLQTSKGEK